MLMFTSQIDIPPFYYGDVHYFAQIQMFIFLPVQLVSNCTPGELTEVVLPIVFPRLTVWQFLEMRCTGSLPETVPPPPATPDDLDLPTLVDEYSALHHEVVDMCAERLQVRSDDAEPPSGSDSNRVEPTLAEEPRELRSDRASTDCPNAVPPKSFSGLESAATDSSRLAREPVDSEPDTTAAGAVNETDVSSGVKAAGFEKPNSDSSVSVNGFELNSGSSHGAEILPSANGTGSCRENSTSNGPGVNNNNSSAGCYEDGVLSNSIADRHLLENGVPAAEPDGPRTDLAKMSETEVPVSENSTSNEQSSMETEAAGENTGCMSTDRLDRPVSAEDVSSNGINGHSVGLECSDVCVTDTEIRTAENVKRACAENENIQLCSSSHLEKASTAISVENERLTVITTIMQSFSTVFTRFNIFEMLNCVNMFYL